jgi:selenocysteine lyase/cysteine desulfurase
MAGEGVCFLHSPQDYAPRPVDTGWYAGFGQLETGVSEQVPYAADGTRFSGATYDPSGVYRMNAVLTWLAEHGVTAAEISTHVQALQTRFLEGGVAPGHLSPEIGHERGNFLSFRTPHALALYHELHKREVITDHRGDRLRIGFGIYQDEADVDRLLSILEETLKLGPGA